MYRRKVNDWRKHIDFIFLDIIVMLLSYVAAYMIFADRLHPFFESEWNLLALFSYLIGNLISAIVFSNYKDILKRKTLREAFSMGAHVLAVSMVVVLILFLSHQAGEVSRLFIVVTGVIYFITGLIARLFWKVYLKKSAHSGKNRRSLLIVTVSERAEEVISAFTENNGDHYDISGIVLMERDALNETVRGIRVVANKETFKDYVCREWVDEVFFDLGEGYVRPEKGMMDLLSEMGITVHVKMQRRKEKLVGYEEAVEPMGPYVVYTRTKHAVRLRELLLKRGFDFLAGIVGVILTAILTVFIGPIIYFKSPGPIFFKQTRIGENGRRFKMYKFRSMYPDAEERKKEYMKENRVSDGMMFKLDFDPRIIGNKILPDGTKKTGIGEFIRKTSLDEFPQFLNVLKGDMSLVGTRPPTLDEWEKYEPHHRARMSVRPGITGLWQISGRSEITDFEKVVDLDRQYIENWSFGMDAKILLKTIAAVLRRKGSM